MVTIPRLAAAHCADDVESQIFRSHGWNTANVGSSCAISLQSLTWGAAVSGRHRRRTDGRRRYRDCRRVGGAGWRRGRGEVVWKHRLSEQYRCHNAGPRFSQFSRLVGSRNRLVGFSLCRHPPLPRSRASAPAEHFLQRLPAEISRDVYVGNRDPLGSVLSGRSDGTSGREYAVVPQPIRLLFSSRSQPQERLPFGATMPRRGQSRLCRGGVVSWTVLLRKGALGWTNEQRATAELADVASVSSVVLFRSK